MHMHNSVHRQYLHQCLILFPCSLEWETRWRKKKQSTTAAATTPRPAKDNFKTNRTCAPFPFPFPKRNEGKNYAQGNNNNNNEWQKRVRCWNEIDSSHVYFVYTMVMIFDLKMRQMNATIDKWKKECIQIKANVVIWCKFPFASRKIKCNFISGLKMQSPLWF